MKQILLFFIAIILVMPFMSKAQSYVVEVPYGYPIQNSIVRELPNSDIVSYVETSSDHWITFASSATNIVEKIQIPTTIFINDMYIHDELVYFCGYDNGNGQGVWGWFDNNAAQMAANGLTYYDNFSCGNCLVEEFKALVVYMRGVNTPLFVALVGSANDSGLGKRACTVSINGTAGSTTGWSYTIGLSPDPNEKLTNICLTDNYVVAAGVAGMAYTAEQYRIHNKLSMWDGQANTRYYFPWGMISVQHYWDEFAITHVGGNTIAAATPCQNLSNPTNPEGILLNVYDMALTLTNNCCIQPVYSVEYDYLGSIGQYHIKDLRYSATGQTFSILMTGTFSTLAFTGTAVAQIPYPGGATIDIFTRIDQTSFSMDHFMSQSRFLASGRDDNNTSSSIYFTQPHFNQGNCSTPYPYILTPGQFDSKSDTITYDTCNNFFDCLNEHVTYEEVEVKTICE